MHDICTYVHMYVCMYLELASAEMALATRKSARLMTDVQLNCITASPDYRCNVPSVPGSYIDIKYKQADFMSSYALIYGNSLPLYMQSVHRVI